MGKKSSELLKIVIKLVIPEIQSEMFWMLKYQTWVNKSDKILQIKCLL